MSAIRAAKDWGKRPTASVMGDEWYGHRDWFTGLPRGDKDEWVEWDWALIRAFQTVEDWTDSHGLLRYEVDDPKQRTYVEAVKKIDQFEAAKDRITSRKNYKPDPGEYFAPRLEKRSKEWPTLQEYIEHEIEKEQKKAPVEVPDEPRFVQN